MSFVDEVRLLEVLQKEFAVTTKHMEKRILATFDVLTCTVAIGYNAKHGIAFLFHLDSVGSAFSIGELFLNLRKAIPINEQLQFDINIFGGRPLLPISFFVRRSIKMKFEEYAKEYNLCTNIIEHRYIWTPFKHMGWYIDSETGEIGEYRVAFRKQTSPPKESWSSAAKRVYPKDLMSLVV